MNEFEVQQVRNDAAFELEKHAQMLRDGKLNGFVGAFISAVETKNDINILTLQNGYMSSAEIEAMVAFLLEELESRDAQSPSS